MATEPFHEWVVSGRFPAGRPRWEDAGARFVDDVTPFEQRKLWLLNGSHSLLAYAGSIRGHETIDEAIADPRAGPGWRPLWDEAAPHLPLPADDVAGLPGGAARAGTPTRASATGWPRSRPTARPRSSSGSVPVMRAERAAGRVPLGCATAVAAWILHLRGAGRPAQRPGRRTVPGGGRRR